MPMPIATPATIQMSAGPTSSCQTANGTMNAPTRTIGPAIIAIAAAHCAPKATRPYTSILFITSSRRSSFIRPRPAGASLDQRQLEARLRVVDRHQRADAAEERQRDLVVLRQPAADPLVALVAREAERVLGQRRADAAPAHVREHPDAEHDGVRLDRVVVERGEADDR